MKVLLPITGAFHGRLRVRRSTGTLDTEGLERILSEPSVRAISLAKQLQKQGAEIHAVHVDKGGGEDVLREALAHGLDQGILVEGADHEHSDASVRAATIADVYRQHGRFDAVIGPGRSEFAGFSGTLAAVAGHLEVPCFIGVHEIERTDGGFRLGYRSIFGEYELNVPSPCVIMPGHVPPSYPTSWGIREAYQDRGLLRVQVDQYASGQALTKRLRIEAIRSDASSMEEVDGATLVRRLRSRAMLPESVPEVDA